MTAFPVAKLPLHPPENTNTLWASPGNNERGGDGGRDTQTDGEEKKSDARQKSEEIKLKSEKMRHMHTYGII